MREEGLIWSGRQTESERKRGCVLTISVYSKSDIKAHTHTHLSLHLSWEFARGHREGGGQMGPD